MTDKSCLFRKLLLILSIILISGFSIYNVEATEVYDFTYQIENQSVIITNYTGNETEVIIPSSIEGYPVTTIGQSAFYGNKTIKSVTIPIGITTIEDYAFNGCIYLESIVIPEGVTSIGKNAFYDCRELKNVILPQESLISIESAAFSSCSKLSDIILPDSITTLGSSAFYACRSLSNINIPKGLTTIEDYVFELTGLTNVDIPSNITSIGKEAFSGCEVLTDVTIPQSVTSIGNDAFYVYSWIDRSLNIHGYKYSAAHYYCIENEHNFIPLDSDPYFLVQFDSRGGTSVESIKVSYNSYITEPEHPTLDGYVFEGWYKDYDCTELMYFQSEKIVNDITLYAKWSNSDLYGIDFSINGYGVIKTSAGFSAHPGEVVELFIEPYYGYSLNEYSLICENAYTGSIIPIYNNTFIMPDAPVVIYAEFVRDSYRITIDESVRDYIDISDYEFAYEGDTVIVYLCLPIGTKLVDNSLCYKINGEGEGILIENNQFIMPAANITITAQFEASTEYDITVAQSGNGKVEVNRSKAFAGELIDVTITPDPGYVLKDRSIRINDDTYYMYSNEISFTMPDEDIVIYVEFVKHDLLAKDIFNLNQDRWRLRLNIPYEKVDEVYSLGHGKYVSTVIRDDQGNVVLENIRTLVNYFDSYYLYKTSPIKAGNYSAEITVGDNNSEIYLGEAEINFGDYLEIENIYVKDYYNVFTTNTRNFTANFRIPHLFSNLENFNVNLVEIGTGNKVAEVISKKYIYYEDKNNKESTTGGGYNIDYSELEFEFVVIDSLKIDKEYAFDFIYNDKEIVLEEWVNNVFTVTSEPKFFNGEMTDDAIYIKTEGLTEGSYTVYLDYNEMGPKYTLEVDVNGNGTIDISQNRINENYANFMLKIGEHNFYFSANKKYEYNKYPYIFLDNSVFFGKEIDYIWAEYALPITNSISFELFDYEGYDAIYLKSGNILKEIGLDTLVDGIGEINYNFEPFKSYEIGLVKHDGERYLTSFVIVNKPLLSTFNYEVEGFYGNLLKVPYKGIVNIDDLSNLKFYYDSGNLEEIPVLNITADEITLDVTNAPSGIFNIRIVYPDYYDGEDYEVITSNDLRYYRIYDESAVITYTGEDKGVYYAEGLNLAKIGTAYAKIYKAENGKYVGKSELVKVSDTRLEIPQSAFAELAEGKYVVYYVIDGKDKAAQLVNYSNKLQRFTVRFESNGGTEIEDITNVIAGTTINQPETPIKLGYGFDGWYKDASLSQPWNFEVDKVTSDITLYAKWIENAYTVTFQDYDGSVIKTQSVKHGESATAPAEPQREGHTFAGWDKEFSNIIADTVITATYTPNVYTVTFESNGGTAVESQKVAYGDPIVQPAAPIKEGYGFGGWFEDPGFKFPWNFETSKVTADTILYAKWIENAYTVTFVDFDDSVIYTQSVAYGESATAPANPTREGYTFKGWDKEFNKITANTTIKAVYEINKYTVTFVDYDGKELKKEVVEYNQAATAPTAPERTGYTFKNWDKPFDKVSADIVVKAVYEINKYTVTFVNWDDTVLKIQNDVEHGTAATAPANPTRDGYKFVDWDKTFDNITGDLTVKAIFTAGKYDVYFNSMGGSSVAPIIDVERDSKINEPTAPTRAGYEFAGWYKDFALTKKWDFNTDVVTGNTVLYAKWTAISYKITVNDEITGGTIIVKNTARPGEVVYVQVEPKEGNTLKSIWWSTGTYASQINLYDMSFIMPARDIEINVEFNEMVDLTVNVSKANSPYYVYIYGYDNDFYNSSYVSEVTTSSAITTGSSIITNTSILVPNKGMYSVYINMGENDNWFWDYKLVKVNGQTEVDFIVPTTYSISGKVDFINGSSGDVYVYAYSNEGSGSSYVRPDGSYEIKGLIPGDYTVEVNMWNSNFKGDSTKKVTVSDENVDGINFVLVKGADLRVTLAKTSGTPAFKAYVTLYKLDGSYWGYVASSTGSGTGEMLLDGAITDEGKYKLVLDYLENKNYTSSRFVSSPVEFEVSEEDIATGTIGKTITYSDPIDAAVALSGSGNLVATDVKTAQKGSFVSLTIRYKNNGNTEISPIFTINVPEGITVTGSKTHTAVLSPNENGEYKVVLNIGKVNSEIVNIDVNVSLDGQTYDFGDANINITRVTLNSPANVKTNNTFKVYGEATEGSIVKIKNALTGQVYATVTPHGKFYTAEIKLPEGIAKLVAEALLDGTVAQSNLVEVKAQSKPIIVDKVYKDGSQLQLNSRLGVYVFSQYVDMSLMGFDFTLRTEFENSDEISKVVYHFADMDFEADSNFSAIFKGWGGAGLKPIKATVTTKSGEVLEFIIAEVTVLIDPSGVVTNAVTGEPLEGVLVTCWVLNPKTNIWEVWDAESYGQVNPQYTDKDGKYGWMVPEGKYRITAKIDNFADYDTILDENFSSGFETTIIIPPPRDDVDFSMVPDTFVISKDDEINGGTINVKETAQFTETVNVTANPNEGKRLKYIIVDGKAIEGTSFVMPAKNIIISAEFEDIPVVEPETPGGGGSSGGGSSGGGSSGGGSGTSTETNTVENEYTVDSQGRVTINPEQLSKAESLTIKGDITLIIDKKTLNSIGVDKELSVSIKKADIGSLSSADKKLIGNRPVYEINIKSGTSSINKFGGNIRVQIPYKLSKGENADYVRVYYISDSGVVTRVANGYYDVKSESVIFTTDHFSKYAIGYSEVEFKDVEGWAEQYIYYLADRAIVSGKGNGLYAPNDSVTRAEFVKILSGVAGVDLSKYNSVEFADVKPGDWFEKAVAWASETGITSGISEKEFAPNAKITREQMATMIVRFAEKIGYSLEELSEPIVFADQDKISAYAVESVAKIQRAGIIVGKENNMFDPKGNATRAEASKVLAVLMQGLR